ncbi:MAG: hypothetical protein HFI09_00060 [Bacilli bacterium]|nr:hypothetical protein [Bacilli bacterium]
MQQNIPPLNHFLASIDPPTFSFTAVLIGAIIVGDLNVNEQNAIGNWLELVGQYVLTNAAQQQVLESQIENNNININSKKSKNGGGPFTTDSNKSNQTQRDEVDFLLQEIQKIERELQNLKKNSNP